MHYLYFVKVNNTEAHNAREAIKRARSILDGNSFCGTEGFWGNEGKCDWYIVGGRWSGEFVRLFIKGDFYHEVLKLVRSKNTERANFHFLTTVDCEEYAEDIQHLWLALGGKGVNPYARDIYEVDGFDDDAVVLTEEIITALQGKYGDEVEYFDSDRIEERTILALSAEDIGHWLVVVDYHG